LTRFFIKFSVNGIAIDPRPILGEPIPQGCLYLLVWIQSSPTPFCPLGAHGVQARMWISVVIRETKVLIEKWEGLEREVRRG
jgi:hypothetical protein